MFAFLVAAALQIPLPSPGRPTEAVTRRANEAWARCSIEAALRGEPSDRPVEAVVTGALASCSAQEAAFWRSWQADMAAAGVSSADQGRMRTTMEAEMRPGLTNVVLQNRPAHLLSQLQERIESRRALQLELERGSIGDSRPRQRALLTAVDLLMGTCWNQVTAANARTAAAAEAIVALARERCRSYRAELRELFKLGLAIDGRVPDDQRADFEVDLIEQRLAERMLRGVANIRRQQP